MVFCILALGSGQRFLYRLGSGIGLVSDLVLRFCALKLIFRISAFCKHDSNVYKLTLPLDEAPTDIYLFTKIPPALKRRSQGTEY